MDGKTLILDIHELYKVIPECKALEGKNFKDIKELLINLVDAIETSGQWEFIQYVNNKPSLFVIRKVQSSISGTQFESKKFQEFERMYKDVKNLVSAAQLGKSYVSTSYEGRVEVPNAAPLPDVSEAEDVLKTDTMKETEKTVQENLSNTYVPSVKLPWE